MGKKETSKTFGEKLIMRAEAVRDYYHNKDESHVRVRTMKKVEFIAHKSYSAKQIKSIREATGLTQQNLAELMSTSVDTVRKWEQNCSSPSGPALRLLQMLEKQGVPDVLIAERA